MKIFDKLLRNGKKKKKRHDLKKNSSRRKQYVPQDSFLLAGNQPAINQNTAPLISSYDEHFVAALFRNNNCVLLE